jgi:hypothetical protein
MVVQKNSDGNQYRHLLFPAICLQNLKLPIRGRWLHPKLEKLYEIGMKEKRRLKFEQTRA